MLTIGITGRVMTDGIGDLEHILTGGERLKKQRPDMQFVYHIQYERDYYKSNAKKRLVLTVDKLLHYGLIRGTRDDYLSQEECDFLKDQETIIGKINQSSNEKLTLYIKNDGLQLQKVIKTLNVYVWISLSVIPMTMNGAFYIEMPREKTIYLMEHGSSPSSRVPDYGPNENGENSTGQFKPDKNYTVSMGFSRQKNGPRGVGIFLQNKKLNAEERAGCLSKIENENFHRLLNQGNPDKLPLQQIEEVIFIPCYFLNEEIGYHFLLNAYKGILTLEDPRHLFLQGTLHADSILADKSIARLVQLGFNKVVIVNNKNQLIERMLEGNGNKTCMVLEDVYMYENDYRLFKQLATVFMGCSGDNTFQDAISMDALPVFIPHSNDKIRLMQGLKEVVDTEIGDPVVSNFLSLYSNLKYKNVYIRDQEAEALLQTENIYSPLLLDHWQRVCQYLRENYNTHDSLLNILDRFLQAKMKPNPVMNLFQRKAPKAPPALESKNELTEPFLHRVENNSPSNAPSDSCCCCRIS